LLIATRRRTWGPQGRPPVVHYNYKHDRISSLAVLTISPVRHRVSIYVSLREDNFKAIHVGPFLRSLLRQLPGPIILLWDQGQIHKGPVIREVLLDNQRLQTEFFPKYAPELNPVEQVWHDFKSHTANSLPQNKQDIEISIHANTFRVRRSQDKLRSFILASELPSPFDW
jgi:transposase